MACGVLKSSELRRTLHVQFSSKMFRARERRRLRNCTIAAAGFVIMCTSESLPRKQRKIWVKKYREQFSHMPLLNELQENYPDDYKNYLRMDVTSFNMLLNLVKNALLKKDTVMRKSISPEERLIATLRFLATGRSFEDLKFSTGISPTSLSRIIPETCKAICDVLRKEYMNFPTSTAEWLNSADGFTKKWQFVNCGGALDGKHIRIVPPKNSGSKYYNYKGYHSIILMALVNSNYEFIYVDVGKNGRMSDGGVLEYTDFYSDLQSGQLNLPLNNLNVNNLNFVFVGDEAFALHEHFLRPYPQKDLDYEKRIFNYRLSRARNVVENAFGIISSRFRILHTPINLKVKSINYVILAIWTLHNFLRKRSSGYMCASTVDREDFENCVVQNGDWRRDVVLLTDLHSVARNPNIKAKQVREAYKKYFLSEGSVPWQETIIAAGRA